MSRYRTSEKTIGHGYVGQWSDGSLGWFMPAHLSGNGRKYPDKPRMSEGPYGIFPPEGGQGFLCRITVERVRDKRGRPIVRRVKP